MRVIGFWQEVSAAIVEAIGAAIDLNRNVPTAISDGIVNEI